VSGSAGGERREVHYQGRVQGVGFRYTARAVARNFQVTGYVMNLDDGRVRLVAEGEAAELDRFLAQIGEKMGDCIRDCNAQTLPATGEFADFRIEH
jgi:acylphosphatase